MKFEQIFSLRCQTEQAQSTRLDANSFSNDQTTGDHLYSTPRRDPQDHRGSRRSLRIAYWWSRTGSNRRHPACKAGALPAELRPLIVFPTDIEEMVGLGGLEPPTSRLSSARSNQLSYKPLDCALDQLSPPRRTSRKADRPSRLVPRPRGAPAPKGCDAARERKSKSFAKKEKRRRQTRFRYARR